jgi:pilus assembly protein CpaB
MSSTLTGAKGMFQILAALGLALLAGVLVFQWTRAAARAAAQARPAPLARVAAAARDLPRGYRLEPKDVVLVPFAASPVPDSYFQDPAPLAGRSLLAPAGKGEPLSETRLAPAEGGAGGMASLLTPGKRAIAVKGNKVLGLAGLIQPGNRVDVVATLEDEQIPGRVRSKTVLENVLVLGAGAELEPGDDGKPATTDTYTLELGPAEGETLALAATKGTLNFALRGAGDNATVPTLGADYARALGGARPGGHGRPGAAPREAAVELIRGGHVERVHFRSLRTGGGES